MQVATIEEEEPMSTSCSSQIFRSLVPLSYLRDLLDRISPKDPSTSAAGTTGHETDYYVVNQVAFKKGMFNQWIAAFLEQCKPYYHASKVKYVERKLNYNSFITVVRQICNLHHIRYESNIRYMKSSYDIYYHVFL